MNYWLIKTEPSSYSWEQLLKDKITAWDGVRNYQARNNLREMKKGDLAFFYHSNIGKEIVGIAKIVKEAYQDPKTDDPNWVAVDIKPHQSLKKPVTLAELKNDKKFEKLELIKLSRISVSHVTLKEFELILKRSEQ